MVAVPPFLILLTCAFHKGFQTQRSFKGPLKVLLTAVVSFATVLVTIAAVNRAVYGTFAIVDIKGVFEDAFESLESVVPNVDLPYAAVSKGVRNKIYRVSPTFAELGQYFDMPGSPLEGYKQPSCSFYPSLCGDYATGWFMWALRDAVALRGGYSTARAASTFYSKMRNEIKRACNSGTISCYHNPVPFMPRFEPGEIYRIPRPSSPRVRSCYSLFLHLKITPIR